MARAFNLAGADSHILVFKNRTPKDLEESLEAFKTEIEKAQIVAFAGGFSAGDEPDGSGKFIANVIREKQVADAITSHLEKKNLILGICNGFQTLIKTVLVPYGKITEPSADTKREQERAFSPTLTFNDIHRHISHVVSAASPWALYESVLEGRPHYIPVSHGEGRERHRRGQNSQGEF